MKETRFERMRNWKNEFLDYVQVLLIFVNATSGNYKLTSCMN